MYAIVEIAGKQYKIAKDSIVNVDKLAVKENEQVVIDKVLFVAKEGEVFIGQPYLDNVKVVAKNLGDFKGEKVRGIKFKKRKNYTRTIGHRTIFSQLKIDDLVLN